MSRTLALVYGVLCYVLFLGAFLYAVGFVEDWIVPKTVNSVPDALASQRDTPVGTALAINLLLLGAFGIPHSVMARPAFKRWWTRFVSPVIERSTYVLTSNLLLALLYWQWRPMPDVVWHVEQPLAAGALVGLSAAGWLMALVSTFLIDHFDLFGLRQVWLNARGRPYTRQPFVQPLLYRWVRHPLMTGFLIAFWSTPRMTQGHLLFAVVTTAYILIAIRLEERDLVAAFGEEYEAYRHRTSMIFPFPRR